MTKSVEEICRDYRPSKPYLPTDMWGRNGDRIFIPYWALENRAEIEVRGLLWEKK